ncbi:uncharacterized protein J7T54_004768 [Emericellopsis cladophorae]|uniref:Uncharacterized protein n=1 Tax=Emericellopsis cladophorae TaxID=2686198 RepID=A0A9Q0BG76_9HYPO|nr:uncharacterized protein J7T54_004768 [Emericellopsis cladophorae]KAI6784222.1 hypothetical protein J7T54_004768 [Emericellopsis cladophorae]
MSSARDRMRLGLNPLTTSLGSYNPHHPGEPISAISMASSHLPSAQTPGSALQPYNPQEWVASPAQVADRQGHYAGDAQGGLPPPPPPYSPPRSQQPRPMSSVMDQAPVLTSTPPPPRIPAQNVHRPSSDPPANQSFPPPPGAGGRGPSRERRFGLPAFGRRSRDSDQQMPVTPEPPSLMPTIRQSIGPGPSVFTPEAMRPLSTASNFSQSGPPAARRAVSAGAVETPTSARSRSGSHHGLDPGIAIPPPPPGPPPSSSRSQSVQGLDRGNVPIISPPTRRPRISAVPTLGPVPPTPAGWVDEPAQADQASSGQGILTIDVETAQHAENIPEPLGSSNSASGLNRARAVRHDKTILQRRAESRTRQGGRGSIDERMRPGGIADIFVPASSPAASTRPPKATPRSASGSRCENPQTGESSAMADSRNSTPRVVGNSRHVQSLEAGTPPFSPFPAKLAHRSSALGPIAPKSLPTPPPQIRSASSHNPREGSRPPPFVQTPVSKHLVVTQSAEQFATGTIERFQTFAAAEACAATDIDRVRLFAAFMVSESRIRRERYATSIGAMGSEIFDLTRDLFRPMVTTRRSSAPSQEGWTPEASEPEYQQNGSWSSTPAEAGPSSAPGSARLPPSPSGGQNAAATTSNFMPSLSPILSMSVSDRYGDGSSRGRPSSRWWEVDSQGDPSRRFERSKRESKYMGVPKDQWAEADPVHNLHGAHSEQGSSTEYPPEKVGWHEPEDAASTPQPARFFQNTAGSTPSPAPGNRKSVDVSRLVTLPPPYPRHHPAVNNNHPELASIRGSVRTLSDLNEIDEIKQRFKKASTKRRNDLEGQLSEQRQALRANLQQEINAGNLGYTDAGAIEADAQAQESVKKRDLEKQEYEAFQTEVVVPVNELLTGRIDTATALHNDLARRLFANGQNDVDMPQEEGDDQPELLEKLTLLKWIFEARESLHRAIYDILSDRNARFRDVITNPYRLSGNTEKLRNAEAFFNEDNAKREYDYANEVLDRAREFRSVVDDAVQRGVALQSSAFWDIAPTLCNLLDSIPPTLEGFNIQIPPAEYTENPSYKDHPMQYLLTLIHHTEKSTYQFIEAHTNLLCLLHEAREAVVNAKARVLATQTEDHQGKPVAAEERETRARVMKHGEDLRLTEDLKEKVRVVEDQWKNALAESIGNVKERIGEWLLETGGWDETLIEDDSLSFEREGTNV